MLKAVNQQKTHCSLFHKKYFLAYLVILSLSQLVKFTQKTNVLTD